MRVLLLRDEYELHDISVRAYRRQIWTERVINYK